MKLLYDVENSRWYNENGESFDSDNPTIPYGNIERVEIQLYSEVKGTNSGSNAVADWTKYTGFTGDGYGAILATDNNFLHWYKASLQTALSAGELAVTTLIDIATSVGVEEIAESGNIYIYADDGSCEAIAYASREAISGGIRFTPASGNELANSYSIGTQADIPEMLYAEATMLAAASDPATGLFVFDFICDSVKLRNKMQYSSVEKVDDCMGLELTVFQTNGDNTVSIRKRFRCYSFRITGGIADIKTGVPVPVPEQNQILALLHGFIAQGLAVQGSADGETWTNYAEIENFQALRWFRLRIKGSSANWSDALPLIVGASGTPGADGEDGADGQSVYPYIAYASDTNGTDFTMEWEENAESSLKYIAYLLSTSPIASPTAADFAGLWVRFGGLDLRAYWEAGGEEESVDWEDIANKPTLFPPSTHQHNWSDINDKPTSFTPSAHTHLVSDQIDKARQTTASEATPNTLYINKDIIVKSENHTSGTLTIDFPYIKDKDGENYTVQSGDVFTWELWITATAEINSITAGGNSTIEKLAGFPETLSLINNAATRHVFTVRGIYKSGAVNNLKLLVNYAYSEAAV